MNFLDFIKKLFFIRKDRFSTNVSGIGIIGKNAPDGSADEKYNY
jgi:hypothetical protein